MIRTAFSAFIAVSILWTSGTRAEEKDQPSYPELGITASSLLLHPSIGYWFGRTGVRFTGMYLNKDQNEFHFNVGYRIFDTAKVQHGVNLLTSWVTGSDPGADYRYCSTGIAYSLNYRGIFLEIGLARSWRDEVGNLANNPVVPCGYWGYIYRFRPK